MSKAKKTLLDCYLLSEHTYVVSDIEYRLRFGKTKFSRYAKERQELRLIRNDLVTIGWPNGRTLDLAISFYDDPLTRTELTELYSDSNPKKNKPTRGVRRCQR